MRDIHIISQRTMLRSLILLSALLFMSYGHAQQQDEAATEEWEMDLSLPAATANRPSVQNVASLPDAAQERKLQ